MVINFSKNERAFNFLIEKISDRLIWKFLGGSMYSWLSFYIEISFKLVRGKKLETKHLGTWEKLRKTMFIKV